MAVERLSCAQRMHFLHAIAYPTSPCQGWLVKEGEGTFIDTMTAFIGIFYAAMGAGQALVRSCFAAFDDWGHWALKGKTVATSFRLEAAMTIGDANKAKVAAHDMFKLLDRESLIDSWEPKGGVPVLGHASKYL
eukprot:2144211-Amphidinium_carterae.1